MQPKNAALRKTGSGFLPNFSGIATCSEVETYRDAVASHAGRSRGVGEVYDTKRFPLNSVPKQVVDPGWGRMPFFGGVPEAEEVLAAGGVDPS